MVMMIALTLGFTVVRPRVLLMACQTMHGYPGRSHIKIFCCGKNFFSLAYSTYFWPTAFMEVGVKLLSHEG